MPEALVAAKNKVSDPFLLFNDKKAVLPQGNRAMPL